MPTFPFRPMLRSVLVLSLLVLGPAIVPNPALANGNHTHLGISLAAIDLLPDGELKTLLQDPTLRQMLLNGSCFPDGGYAIGDGYGETAHWEPYQRAYLAQIQKHYPDLTKMQEGRERVAFLFGMFSHGMADQVYDALFMDSAKVFDAKNWADTLLTSFDTSTDVMWVVKRGPSPIPELWVPFDDVMATYVNIGQAATQETVQGGQELVTSIVLGYPAMAAEDPQKVAEGAARYPWADAHLTSAETAGSPPCEAKVVAAYWQMLWETIHGKNDTQRLVIATIPSDGSAGHPTAHSNPESKLAVVFAHALLESSIQKGAITVTDSKGHAYPLKIGLFYGNGSNVLRAIPQEDWAADETFTVTVHPGMKSIDGLELAGPVSFTFRTGAGTTLPAGLPPAGWGPPGWISAGVDAGGTDAASGVEPVPAPASGGCDARGVAGTGGGAHGRGAGVWLLGILAAGLVRMRRPRSNTSR